MFISNLEAKAVNDESCRDKEFLRNFSANCFLYRFN